MDTSSCCMRIWEKDSYTRAPPPPPSASPRLALSRRARHNLWNEPRAKSIFLSRMSGTWTVAPKLKHFALVDNEYDGFSSLVFACLVRLPALHFCLLSLLLCLPYRAYIREVAHLRETHNTICHIFLSNALSTRSSPSCLASCTVHREPEQ
jgi:hypothetical protein